MKIYSGIVLLLKWRSFGDVLCLGHWAIRCGLRARSCRYWLQCLFHYIREKTRCLPGVVGVSVLRLSVENICQMDQNNRLSPQRYKPYSSPIYIKKQEKYI